MCSDITNTVPYYKITCGEILRVQTDLLKKCKMSDSNVRTCIKTLGRILQYYCSSTTISHTVNIYRQSGAFASPLFFTVNDASVPGLVDLNIYEFDLFGSLDTTECVPGVYCPATFDAFRRLTSIRISLQQLDRQFLIRK